MQRIHCISKFSRLIPVTGYDLLESVRGFEIVKSGYYRNSRFKMNKGGTAMIRPLLTEVGKGLFLSAKTVAKFDYVWCRWYLL